MWCKPNVLQEEIPVSKPNVLQEETPVSKPIVLQEETPVSKPIVLQEETPLSPGPELLKNFAKGLVSGILSSSTVEVS